MNNCTTLSFYLNQISEIEPGGFNGLSNLEYLEILSNRLEIQSNNISSIEDNTFLNLNKLEALFLLNNNLKTLSSRVFCGLTSLNALHLELNHLSTLPADVFSHLPRPLTLGLIFHPNDTLYNLLKCDSQLCWLKQEELQGNITWKISFVVSKCNSMPLVRRGLTISFVKCS